MTVKEIEKIQEEMCDKYCRYPFECNESELETECERCPLLKLTEEVEHGLDSSRR